MVVVVVVVVVVVAVVVMEGVSTLGMQQASNIHDIEQVIDTKLS